MTPEENRRRLNLLRAEEIASGQSGEKKRPGGYDYERRRLEQVNRELLRATA